MIKTRGAVRSIPGGFFASGSVRIRVHETCVLTTEAKRGITCKVCEPGTDTAGRLDGGV